jgi:hypothetical protein
VINEDLLNNLPSDPLEALIAVVADYQKSELARHDAGSFEELVSILTDYYGVFSALISKSNLEITLELPKLDANAKSNSIRLTNILDGTAREININNTNLLFSSSVDKYQKMLGDGFVYEFSDNQVKRIQVILNELRGLIGNSDYFDEDHKDRILRRLEKLQSELHKKVSDLDRLWGLVGDAGVALAKLGTDAKPIVDRIKELTYITWDAQKKSEGIARDTEFPLLENSADD